MSPICHCLIGLPGSGKSTFARQWVEYDPNCVIISTDTIRAELFGDETIQGDWNLIQQEVLNRVKVAVASGRSVIYDATNFKRSQRMDILQKFACVGAETWMGWYLKIPLDECCRRNEQRQRQVGKNIIESFNKQLINFEPIEAEGFAKVNVVPMVNGKYDFSLVAKQIKSLPRSIINRRNCSQKKTLHQYSGLIDFERLMYLISLIIKFPGLGLLHEINPDLLQKELVGNVQPITDSLDEISALMSRKYHSIYAQPEALANDLQWLEKNGILNEQGLESEIWVGDYTGDIDKFEAHTYSDSDAFLRLMTIIRCLVHFPCFRDEEKEDKTVQEIFFESLKKYIVGFSQDTLRKDIQRVLHPYKILPKHIMKRAYFLGNAILNKHELVQVYKVLRSHAKDLDDPISLSIYEGIEKKLELSQILRPQKTKKADCKESGESESQNSTQTDSEDYTDDYRVRAIADSPGIDLEKLSDNAAYKKLDQLTEAILSGQLLELIRFANTGRHLNDPYPNQLFQVWPLQIVFSKIGWYLGYETKGGKADKLFRFERLDRFSINEYLPTKRDKKEQKAALSKLEKLYQSSYSLFLGNSVDEQQKYLNTKQRSSVEITVEIWCEESIFNFLSERTKRLPHNKIKFSKRSGKRISQGETIFVLPLTEDSKYPYCCQLTLPCWSIEDIDLRRWIIGFGDKVKVVQPLEIREQIKLMADGINKLYQ